MNSKQYTTGEVARILSVAPRTVASLFDSGHFDNKDKKNEDRKGGFRLLDLNGHGGHRRIYDDACLSFLARSGYDFELAPYGDEGKVDVVMPDGFLTSTEAAEVMGTAPKTAIRYLLNGKLKGYTLPESPEGEICHKFCKNSLLKLVTENGRLDLLGDKERGYLGLSPRGSACVTVPEETA